MDYYIYDFRLAAFASLKIELTGKGDEVVNVAIGECLKDGRINRNPGGYRYFAENNITLKKGTHWYDFLIPKHIAPAFVKTPNCKSPSKDEIAPFRYVEISNYNSEYQVERKEFFGKFNDDASYFHSSSDNLNRIWEFCKYSIKATSCFDKYVDGNRERLPYEGDAYINQLGHFCCDTNFELAKNTIEHFLKYPTWPTEWQLLTPILVRDYYFYSGDKQSITKWLPLLDQRLLQNYLNVDGLLVAEKGEIRDIIDWPPSERDNYDFGEVNFVPNCYLYASYIAMYQLSSKSIYQQKAEQLKQKLISTFLVYRKFVDSINSKHSSLHSSFFAIAMGVNDFFVPENLIQKTILCSVYGAQFLLEACYKANLEDYAFQLMTSKDFRSWNNMLDKGATITMEAWDDLIKPNQDWNHAWGAAPANIIPRYFCGIRPLEAGFKSFLIAPKNNNIDFEIKHPTIHGTIELSSSGKITIPEGTTAFYKNKMYSHKDKHLFL